MTRNPARRLPSVLALAAALLAAAAPRPAHAATRTVGPGQQYATVSAAVAIPNGKGILIANNSLTVERLEFAGAKVADRNGAGIRYQAGDLTVRKCHFRDNENGILANPVPG